MKYRVAEQFISLNGEGEAAGQPAVFVRFTGCNLSCSYCDTQWANVPDAPFAERTEEEITDELLRTGICCVTLTGGEPLLQPGIETLLRRLAREETLRVEVETNGSVPIAPFTGIGPHRPVFTMDYKLPVSGMESAMCTDNFAVLTSADTVKFVLETRTDWDRARTVVEQYRLTERCHVHFSPVFGRTDLQGLAAYLIEHRMNGVSLRLQLHKLIWDPNARGV